MRIMPFMKRKKGVQFAGIGLDTGGGGGGGSYVLPTATANRLGGVKVGTGLEVAEDGTLSTSGGGGGGSSETYTADEVEVGTWFGTPLYRKAYNGVIPSAGVAFITFDSFNKAVFAHGMFKHSEFASCRMIATDNVGISANGITITNPPTSYNSMTFVIYYIKN